MRKPKAYKLAGDALCVAIGLSRFVAADVMSNCNSNTCPGDEIMTLREKIEREAKIEVIATQDDCQVRGNALASGDEAEDKRVEDWILERLDNGDVWAWAAVEVRGQWCGLEVSEYLGCCCYHDENDFVKNSGYFNDMRTEVIDGLVARAEEIVKKAKS